MVRTVPGYIVEFVAFLIDQCLMLFLRKSLDQVLSHILPMSEIVPFILQELSTVLLWLSSKIAGEDLRNTLAYVIILQRLLSYDLEFYHVFFFIIAQEQIRTVAYVIGLASSI